MKSAPKPTESSKILRIIIICLLLDLLSFTIILPLFPRILLYYKQNDELFNSILAQISSYRSKFVSRDIDIVLFGGLLGKDY
jgi:hypothetical protein